jgi:gentisate 1,2-dioxygenase
MIAQPHTPDLPALNAHLAQAHMRGFWQREIPERSQPRPFGVPYVWKWATIRDALNAASDLVPLDVYGVRRNVGLVNPTLDQGPAAMASPTMSMGFQLVKPGEMARPHRHTASAIRFIVEGQIGAYTVVDGQKCLMERGDLVLTPNWCWHDHHNEGDGPVIWIDGLDAPLVQMLQAGFTEPYPSPDEQPLRSPVDYAVRAPGDLAPPGALPSRLVYKWRDTRPALVALEPDQKSPFDGRCLEYRNPAAGGHTLRTLTCWVQLLEPGETTAAHRHTYTHLYHVFEGQGVTEVDGEEFAWQQGDCLTVPNWTWHRHRSRATAEATILFSMNNSPLLEALGFLREESAS